MGRRRALLAGAGLTAALLAGLGAVGWVGPPAQGQLPPPAPAAGRYQISSFVIPNVNTPGAYVLDTRTGDVFQVVGKNPPERVGSVAEPRPPK